jgi:hypothetical protein
MTAALCLLTIALWAAYFTALYYGHRADRSRRSPVMLYGTERSDER